MVSLLWGVEVKPGQPLYCDPGYPYTFHITQAVLGESEGGSDEAARIYIKSANSSNKIAIGVLSAKKFPQIQLDLRSKMAFELSHTSETASVFFSGYKVLELC